MLPEYREIILDKLERTVSAMNSLAQVVEDHLTTLGNR